MPVNRLASFECLQSSVRQKLKLLPLALALAGCASAPPPATPTSQAPEPVKTVPQPPDKTSAQQSLESMVALQDRLYRIAAPLIVNNSDLCRSSARNLLGFTAKNKYSYSNEFVDASQKSFGLDDRLQINNVLPNSGAARAGLQRGDVLLGVADKPMPIGENAEREATAVLAPLVTGRSNVRLTVLRGGTQRDLSVPLTYACAYGIELGNTDNVVAYSDGHRVLISRGMLNALASDDEVAYVIAKEMAHNSLSHPTRQRMSATVGGIIDNLVRVHPDMSTMSGLAGVKPMPKELDATADKLSLYMLARAGYNVDNAPAFWTRFASQYPATTLNGYTALHPTTDYRVEAMNKTVKDIKAKQAAKKPLMP
ncbi:peptidase M48 [Oxalobacteraceae bacterium OM1]|nr:peptidase M48 [Oxalobacteraceae bacterium OM1]